MSRILAVPFVSVSEMQCDRVYGQRGDDEMPDEVHDTADQPLVAQDHRPYLYDQRPLPLVV